MQQIQKAEENAKQAGAVVKIKKNLKKHCS